MRRSALWRRQRLGARAEEARLTQRQTRAQCPLESRQRKAQPRKSERPRPQTVRGRTRAWRSTWQTYTHRSIIETLKKIGSTRRKLLIIIIMMMMMMV